MTLPILVRPMREQDLPEVESIQLAQPSAAQWRVQEYLSQRSWIAESEGRISGYLVTREIASDEVEILNLAVRPDRTRQGVASCLLKQLEVGPYRTVYLEVRESNFAARALYESLGYRQCGVRPQYYRNPDEDGIVMAMQKW